MTGPRGLIRLARLTSGLLLFAFVALHLANIALGLVSLEAMKAWAPRLMFVLYSRTGVYALYAVAAIHFLAGLHAILARRSLQMRLPDAIQLALGLLIPLLLSSHVVGIRGAIETIGFYADFQWMIAFYWKLAPGHGLKQVLVLVIVWIHGCLGLYAWLRLRAWWPRVAGLVYPVVFALPILALLGFVEAGKEALARLDGEAEFIARIGKLQEQLAPGRDRIMALQDVALSGYAAILIALAAILALRAVAARQLRTRVSYVDGPTVTARRGLTILEVSRVSGVAHADVCSGRARCGTCRVRVLEGAGALTPIGELEAAMLKRLHAGADVRLGCQAVVQGGALVVERLVPVDADAAAAVDRAGAIALERREPAT
jgi:adenylate cyclase